MRKVGCPEGCGDSPMDRTELVARWVERGELLKRLGGFVDGQRLISEMLADVESAFRTEEAELLNLKEAAEVSGLSADHLGRLIRTGRLPNLGQRHRPRVRRGDLPQKPRGLRPEPASPFLRNSRRQIAESVVNSETKET